MVQIKKGARIPKETELTQSGYADILLGLQWGDEGKGKVVDMLAEKYDIIARFQGGPNAGHTLELILNGKKVKIVLHTVPSGIMSKHALNVIGSGVVFSPTSFTKEMKICLKHDKTCMSRIMISDRATLIHPLYVAFDILSEIAKGKRKAIGTTAQGIGPSYGEHYYRNAMRVGDILLPEKQFMKKYRKITKEMRARILHYQKTHGIKFFARKNKDGVRYSVVFEKMEKEWLRSIKKIKRAHIIRDTVQYLNHALKQGKTILAEGAQGGMLDIDFGDYPNVTSSHTVAAGACIGLGIKPQAVRRVIGVIKFYTTKVGNGTFPSRMDTKNEELFRKAGNEYGATTGRPRNCGWLDLVQLKYIRDICGVTHLVVLKTDVCPVEELLVVTGYKNDVGKVFTDSVPQNLTSMIVRVKDFPAWTIAPGTTATYQVPPSLRNYIGYIEVQLQVPVIYIGTGPTRSDIVEWRDFN